MNQAMTVKDAERILLTEQIARYLVAGCALRPDMVEDALALGINIQKLSEVIESRYSEKSDEDNHE